MNDQVKKKLWVLKLCLKIAYPKLNFYQFLVFLVIKFRIRQKRLLAGKTMDTFTIKTAPGSVVSDICKDNLDYNLNVVQHKCVVISREQYIQLCAENLFFLDHGTVWLAMKIAPATKRNHKKTQTLNEKILTKFNFSFMTSEIHKKLFTDDEKEDLNLVKITPVIGSKLVEENTAFVEEIEFQNIVSAYGLDATKKIDISFHPIQSLDYLPKIAAITEVSLIVNEYDLSNDFVKEVLSNHFETPKLLSVNDVFIIELTPENTDKYRYKYIDLVESVGRLYFKCNKISNVTESNGESLKVKCDTNVTQPYFIVKGVTQLTISENIHKLKPKDEFYNTTKKDKDFLKLCPSGLRDMFDQMQESIKPFLTGEMNKLTSSMSRPIIPMLLLTGSLGSGRHLLVKTLARYNGINCLQIDCNTLQSSTAKQTESKISSTVQKAKAAAPVIVLLDNFEVFAVDPENNEDCRVVEYFINTLTDLYQNYTKHQIIFISLTERLDLKPNILRIFLDKFHIPRLNAKQRYEMLKWFASVMELELVENEYETLQNSEERKSKKIEQNNDKHLRNNDTSLQINDENLENNDIKLQNHEEILLNMSQNTQKPKPINIPDNTENHTKDALQRIASKTETFLYGDLDTLVHIALRESYLKQLDDSQDVDMRVVKEDDFNSALDSIRSLHSQHLDAPKIPKVYWDDIGGLDALKKELLKTIEFPIKYPHLFKDSALKRSGILLYGPPGCGKTLVAKAVSTELNVSFLSVKGPELLNMYIGQSEENVRKVFESARASSPCIVFLDELDALAPRRGAAGDSGGASDRLVSQLLAELDGVTQQEDADTTSLVFVMGATNRPDLLEQSLLRPGRLDKLIYVGPYCGQREKTAVINALCRNYKLCPEVNLSEVAAALPERVTGADLLQIASTARSNAVRKLVGRLQAGVVKESELSPDSVVIGVSDIYEAVKSFRPSVTDEELAYYESVQAQM